MNPKIWTLADDLIGDDAQLGTVDYVDRLAAALKVFAEAWIADARDNWEPADGDAWSGGFAENH